LIRDLTAHSEGLAAQKEFGEHALDIAKRLFDAWEDFQKHRDRRRLKREVAPLRRELKTLLQRGSEGRRNKLTWGISKNLLKVWPALWTFIEVEGVEPTKNIAERALRARHLPQAWRFDQLGATDIPPHSSGATSARVSENVH
jgi:transposase